MSSPCRAVPLTRLGNTPHRDQSWINTHTQQSRWAWWQRSGLLFGEVGGVMPASWLFLAKISCKRWAILELSGSFHRHTLYFLYFSLRSFPAGSRQCWLSPTNVKKTEIARFWSSGQVRWWAEVRPLGWRLNPEARQWRWSSYMMSSGGGLWHGITIGSVLSSYKLKPNRVKVCN